MGRAPPLILGPFFVKYSVVCGHFSKIIARIIEIPAYFCALVEDLVPFYDVFFDLGQKPFYGDADEMRNGDSELHGGQAK